MGPWGSASVTFGHAQRRLSAVTDRRITEVHRLSTALRDSTAAESQARGICFACATKR